VNELGHSRGLILFPAELLNKVENDLISGLRIESKLVRARENTISVVSRLLDCARTRAIGAGVIRATDRESALSSVLSPLFPHEEVVDDAFSPCAMVNSADLEVSSNLVGILHTDIPLILNCGDGTSSISSLRSAKNLS